MPPKGTSTSGPRDAKQRQAMRRGQAALDHVAARGHAAVSTPPGKRSAEQKQDIKTFRRAFGESPFADQGRQKKPKRGR
jgi:hypothetical protein